MAVGLVLVAVWFALVAAMLVQQFLTDAFAVEVIAPEPVLVEAVDRPSPLRPTMTLPAA